MNYLLYGEEDYLIKEEVKKIVKSSKVDEMSVINYDVEIDNIKDIIEDCNTVSFFNPTKVIIVNNCNYFNRVKCSEEDINLLLEYLTNSNPDTTLILINHNSTIDSTKKITKKIKEVGSVLEFNKANPTTLVKKMFSDYKISSNNIELLIKRVGEDIEVLASEVNKLKIYKYDEKEITEEDIINCSIFNIDTDIFKFIDNIINKNKEDALCTYHEMLKNNEEPIKIIALLASKFRLMYQACKLDRKGINANDISALLSVHSYPVKLAIKAGSKYPEKVLLNYLKSLADLDQDIKTGKVNPELGVELFILKV